MSILHALCVSQFVAYGVDAVVLLTLLIFAIVCAKRGFVSCFFSLVSTVAALILAFALAKPFAALTNGFFGLEEIFSEKFVTAFSKLSGFNMDISGSGIEAALADKNLPAILGNLVISKFGSGALAAGTTLGMVVGETTASLTVIILSFIALFIVIKLVLLLLKNVFTTIIEKLTVFNVLDGFLGALVGLLEGVAIVCLVLSILTIIPSQGMVDFFNQTIVLKVLYNHNPLITVIGWLI